MLNTQRFLQVSGIALLVLFVLGNVGLGPTPSGSLLDSWLYFDPAENLFHLVLAAACLVAYRMSKTDRWLRIISGVIGVLALVVAVVGFLNLNAPIPNAGLAHLELIDTLLHLALALWGFWVAFMPEGPMFVKDGSKAKAIAS